MLTCAVEIPHLFLDRKRFTYNYLLFQLTLKTILRYKITDEFTRKKCHDDSQSFENEVKEQKNI